MTYRVRLTSKALRQLTAAARWWAEHRSVEQAARWLDGFESAINALAVHPEEYRLAP